MDLSQLKSKTLKKNRKRVGRGGKRGTYSGRGMKGQKSRSGRRLKPAIRELIKRYPKLRGYKFKPKIKSPKSKIVIVNLDVLDKKLVSGDRVNSALLLDKKIISRIQGRVPQVKIL